MILGLGDQYVGEGERITFSAEVVDPGHDALLYSWDFGDGEGETGTLKARHTYRDDGDYGDNTSPDFNDFWGMHVWDGALNPNPAWTDPVRWTDIDVFGPVFEVEIVDGAPQDFVIAVIADEGQFGVAAGNDEGQDR